MGSEGGDAGGLPETQFDRVLAGASEALLHLGTGELRTELVSEGPRTYARSIEAPAAPVAEPMADPERMEALRAIVDSNNGKHAAIAERDARIAALEAELAEAKARIASWKKTADAMTTLADARTTAAVQAERERCLKLMSRLDAWMINANWYEILYAIKNGDAP